MLAKFRPRSAYDVMAALSLVLVLSGGVAYAANTVFSSDIVDGEVKTADLAKGSVQAGKIANNQVFSEDVRDDTLPNGGLGSADIDGLGSADIANESLTAADLGFASVGAGELGGGAIPGQVAPPIVVSTAVNTTTTKELQVPCQFAQDRVTGGGFVIAGPGGSNVPNVAIQRSYAVDRSTWLVRAVATSGTPQWQLTGIATCVF